MEKTKIVLIFFFVLFLNNYIFSEIKRPATKHFTYFKGTDYQLDVYRIYGRHDGKTMLIIGGIQGDEPGGYLSADLYADFKLFKGNLIVIPRANLKSIILYTRGADGDMNRQFNKKFYKTQMGKAVELIKKLMSEADVFLHLHDGWGYHYPEYIDKLRNPYRFGQSIIIDNDTYTCKGGKILNLKEIAEKVLKRVNNIIDNKNYHLHLFNTKTFAPNTRFKDMRKSATFFALTHYCLPSFAIETSKNIPSLELKIRIHNYAINEFMKIYGIIPELPPVIIVKPVLYGAIIKVNNIPEYLKNFGSIFIKKGDVISVDSIDANYKRGVSCDILGYGGLNDYKQRFKILSDTKIIFRKDNKKFGEIYIHTFQESKNIVFVMNLNNKLLLIPVNHEFKVKRGDILKILGIASLGELHKSIKVNLKGFVPKGKYNTGDDRGYLIKVADNFMKKYSKFNKGKIYPIVAIKDNKELGKIWMIIEK